VLRTDIEHHARGRTGEATLFGKELLSRAGGRRRRIAAAEPLIHQGGESPHAWVL
jgi:hypothetical protein